MLRTLHIREIVFRGFREDVFFLQFSILKLGEERTNLNLPPVHTRVVLSRG